MEHAGTWEFPGGKVEPGESDEDALARELWEELGWRAAVGNKVGEGSTGRIHLVGYWCTAQGEPTLTEHDAVAWLRAEDFAGRGWAPADGPILAALAEQMSSEPS
jgi:8-oxo-dGTP diphosphatase